MIYIFEDRYERRRLHQDMMNRYKNVISFAKFDIDEGMDLTKYIDRKFHDAEVMIFHKSYAFKSNNVNIDAIKDTTPSARLVVFSGGIEKGTMVGDGKYVTINADVMYNNLEIFLKYFTNSNEINFEPLLWGESFRLNRLLSFQNRLFREYFINADMDKRIEDNDKGIEICDLLEGIRSCCDDYDVRIQDELENDILSEGDGITWGDLLRIIRKHITKQEQ